MNLSNLTNINFFTTYLCNSRCVSCSIWKNDKKDHASKSVLSKSELQNLFKDSVFVNASVIGLAGGEPTISPFFWSLLEILPQKKNVTITTNALSSKKLIEYLDDTPDRNKYLIQISLDGIGAKNDQMRGVNGAFEKTTFLLEKLKQLNVDSLISFTINKENYPQLLECYEFAQAYGAQFSMRIAYFGGAYKNKSQQESLELNASELDELKNNIDTIIEKELEKPHYPPKIVFMNKIIDYYKGNQKDITCHALDSGVVIDLYGDVFPNCPVIMQPLGNLRDNTLSEIMIGQSAQKLRKKVQDFRCGGCWNDCQVVSNISMDKAFLESEYSRIKISYLKNKPVADTIDFNKSDSPLLLDGWYEMDGKTDFRYKWTKPDFSIVIPVKTDKIHLYAMFPGQHIPIGSTKLEIFAKNQKIGEFSFDQSIWKDYTITFDYPVEAFTECHFKLSDYFYPTPDHKDIYHLKYGIAIQKMSFAP